MNPLLLPTTLQPAQPQPQTAAHTIVAAHRGGAALNPENSRAAFCAAIALGADQIETDVHLSADGEPVLMHDATLDRTALATGPVAAHSLAELRAVLLRGADEVVPHLDELLVLLQPSATNLRLELKVDTQQRRYPQLVSKALARLRVHGMRQRCTVSSFDWVNLAVVQEMAPEMPLIGLVKRERFTQLGGAEPVFKDALAWGLSELALHDTQFEPTQLALAARLGLRLGLYAVNSELSIRRALQWHVAAFTTDHPDLALSQRQGLRLA